MNQFTVAWLPDCVTFGYSPSLVSEAVLGSLACQTLQFTEN